MILRDYAYRCPCGAVTPLWARVAWWLSDVFAHLCDRWIDRHTDHRDPMAEPWGDA